VSMRRQPEWSSCPWRPTWRRWRTSRHPRHLRGDQRGKCGDESSDQHAVPINRCATTIDHLRLNCRHDSGRTERQRRDALCGAEEDELQAEVRLPTR
jgi:hypothetical protein